MNPQRGFKRKAQFRILPGMERDQLVLQGGGPSPYQWDFVTLYWGGPNLAQGFCYPTVYNTLNYNTIQFNTTVLSTVTHELVVWSGYCSAFTTWLRRFYPICRVYPASPPCGECSSKWYIVFFHIECTLHNY